MVKNITIKWMRKTSGTRQLCASIYRLMELAHILIIAILLIVNKSLESCLIIMCILSIDPNALITNLLINIIVILFKN
jgi:hypothetical protein